METIELGGRRWRIIETGTLERVLWMDRHVVEAGLGRMLQSAAAQNPDAESAGEVAGRIWEQISRADKAIAFLAGSLVPEHLADDAWTWAVADETAMFLKKLTAPEDHARVRSLLVSVVMGFFVAARRSAALSSAVSETGTAAAARIQ